MLKKADLKKIAKTRLAEARILCQKKHCKYEGVIHLCGYAVEIAFKKKICDALNWADFPETKNEFKGLKSFKTHELPILLKLSGQELKLKKNPNLFADWSNILQNLNPKIRYSPIGKVTPAQAKITIDATYELLKFLEVIR